MSPSTQAAQIVASAGGVASTTVVDLSAASAACTVTGENRNCTASVTVPFGSVTFTVTTYDAAPVNGVIPQAAHILGTGSNTQVITRGGGAVAIAIDAQVSGFGNLPAFTSMPGDGLPHTFGFVLNPTDFDNNPIANGATDPYDNPITATLTETGGAGHAHLVLNGVSSGVTATLTKSTDTIAVAYDGLGAVGYSMGVSFSAQGVAVLGSTISPLFVTSASPNFATPKLSLAGNNASTFTVSETGAPANVVYTATGVGCANIATVGAVTLAAGAPTFTVTGVNRGSCTANVSDGVSTVALNVANSGIMATSLGPNHVFVGTANGVLPYSITAAFAAIPNTYAPALPTAVAPFSPYAFDPSSNILWSASATTVLHGNDDSTGAALATATLSGAAPASALAVDSSGTVYACVNGATAQIQVFAFGATAPGTIAQTTIQTCASLAVDAKGYIYALDSGLNNLNVYAPLATNAGATVAVQGRQETAAQALWQQPTSVALDPAGKIYVNDASANVGGVYILAAGTTGAASTATIGYLQFLVPFTLADAPTAAAAVDSSGNLVVCAQNVNNPGNSPGYIYFYTAAQVAQLIANGGGQPTGSAGLMNSPDGDTSGCGALVAY